MKRFIVISAIVVISLVGFGFAQNYLSNPVRGCQKFDASSGFVGYRCKNNTKYIAK